MNVIIQKVWESLNSESPELAQRYLDTFPKSQVCTEDLERALKEQNNYWRLTLASLENDTLQARKALVDWLTLDDWFDGFTHDVLPVIKAHWGSSV